MKYQLIRTEPPQSDPLLTSLVGEEPTRVMSAEEIRQALEVDRRHDATSGEWPALVRRTVRDLPAARR